MERDMVKHFICHESASLLVADGALMASEFVGDFLESKKDKVITYESAVYRDTLKNFYNGEAEVAPLSEIQLKRKCFCFMPATNDWIHDLLVNKCTFLYMQDGLRIEEFISRVEKQCRGYSTFYSTYASYQLVCGENVYMLQIKKDSLKQDEIEVYQPTWDVRRREFHNTLMYTGSIKE